jgi:hypothetical protein
VRSIRWGQRILHRNYGGHRYFGISLSKSVLFAVKTIFCRGKSLPAVAGVGCDSLNLLQATRLPPQQSVDETKAPGGFLLAALVSVGWVVSLGLLRLEQSFNDRTINRGHSDPVALIGCFWCLPVLDELVASSVIPQGG